MSNSKITFSKEIAETIGLREAILLDQLKKEGNQNRLVSFKEICSDLSFLPAQEVEGIAIKACKNWIDKFRKQRRHSALLFR